MTIFGWLLQLKMEPKDYSFVEVFHFAPLMLAAPRNSSAGDLSFASQSRLKRESHSWTGWRLSTSRRQCSLHRRWSDIRRHCCRSSCLGRSPSCSRFHGRSSRPCNKLKCNNCLFPQTLTNIDLTSFRSLLSSLMDFVRVMSTF